MTNIPTQNKDDTKTIKIYDNEIKNFAIGVQISSNPYVLDVRDNNVVDSTTGFSINSLGKLTFLSSDSCSNQVDIKCDKVGEFIVADVACDKVQQSAGCAIEKCSLPCNQARSISLSALNLNSINLERELKAMAKVRHTTEEPQYVKLTLDKKPTEETQTQFDLKSTSENNVYSLDVDNFPAGDYGGKLEAKFNSGIGAINIQFNLDESNKVGPIEIFLPYGSTGKCEKYPRTEEDYSKGEICNVNDYGESVDSGIDFNEIETGISQGALKSCTFNEYKDILFAIKINDDASKKYDIYLNNILVDSIYGGQKKEMNSYLFDKSQPDANTVVLVNKDVFREETEAVIFDVYINYIDTSGAITISSVRPFTFKDDFLFYKPNKPESEGVKSEYFTFKTSKYVQNINVIFNTYDGFGNVKTISKEPELMKKDVNYNYYSILPVYGKDPKDPFTDISKGYIFLTNNQGKSKSQSFEIKMSEIHDWALESSGEGSGLTDPDINYFEATKYDFAMGNGVNIAVADTGIDTNNPFLNGKIYSGLDYIESDGTILSSLFDDSSGGHGTFVAGIIASDRIVGEFTGIAPQAKIYSYIYTPSYKLVNNILDKNNQIKIISVSKGNNFFNDDPLFSLYIKNSKISYEKAMQNNLITFVAAGNSGCPGCQGAPVNFEFGIENSIPSAFDETQSIGAIDKQNKLVYKTTNWASQVDGYLNINRESNTYNWVTPTKNVLDFVAPGDTFSSLVSTTVINRCLTDKTFCYTRGYPVTGTSAATPIASAIAAVILSNCNDKSILTADKILDIMNHGADINVQINRPMISGSNPEYYRGKGKLKLDKALEYMYKNYPECIN